tara:strand:- start:9787 stop:11268 length:1482 start_codon:yes stop_codon:yes gene_type:complete
MAKLDDYKDLWGEDFGELVKLFRAGVTPELENLLVGIVDSMVFDARSFALNIEKSVANMAQTGMSMNLIEDVLTEDMQTGGKIFGQLRNNIKETTAKAINQSSRLGQYSTYFANPELLMDSPSESKPMKFMWVTVAGHKVCRDCISRSGRIKTFDEWSTDGLPGAGQTVCGGYCYCIIDPIGQMDEKIDAPVEPEVNAESAKSSENIALASLGDLSPQQMKLYKKAFDLDSDNAVGLLKRKGLTKAEALKQIADHRLKLQSVKRDTRSLYFNSESGRYVRDRAILHSRIARTIVQEGKIAKTGRPDFLMTGGVPGAGKSTMLEKAFGVSESRPHRFVHVDSDRIKGMLAAFDDTKITWNAGLYHEEADSIIKMIFQQSYNQRRHILFDGTMKTGPKMVKFLDWFSTTGGYRPLLGFVDVNVDIAIERAIARSLNNGRFVEPAYILTHLGKNRKSYELLKSKFPEMEYVMFDNNVFGREPKLLEASSFFDFLNP